MPDQSILLFNILTASTQLCAWHAAHAMAGMTCTKLCPHGMCVGQVIVVGDCSNQALDRIGSILEKALDDAQQKGRSPDLSNYKPCSRAVVLVTADTLACNVTLHQLPTLRRMCPIVKPINKRCELRSAYLKQWQAVQFNAHHHFILSSGGRNRLTMTSMLTRLMSCEMSSLSTFRGGLR